MKNRTCRFCLKAGLIVLFSTIPVFAGNDVDFHGSVSATASYSDKGNFYGEIADQAKITLLEGILNVTKQTKSDWVLGAQVYAYELDGSDDVTLDFAYARYSWNEHLGVSLGRNKLAFGLYNDAQDIDSTRTFSTLPIGFYPAYLRPVMASSDGLNFFGTKRLSPFGSIDYRLSVGYLEDVEDGSSLIRTYSNSQFKWNHWNFKDLGYSSQVGWRSPDSSMRMMYSFFDVPEGELEGNAIDGGTLLAKAYSKEVKILMEAFSFEYCVRKWLFAAEYKWLDLDTYVVVPEWGSDQQSVRYRYRTYYISGSYQVSEKLGVGFYYSVYDNDRDDRNDGLKVDEVSDDYNLALSYEIVPGLILKAEAHKVVGSSILDASPRGNNIYTLGRKWNYFVLKSTWYF